MDINNFNNNYVQKITNHRNQMSNQSILLSYRVQQTALGKTICSEMNDNNNRNNLVNNRYIVTDVTDGGNNNGSIRIKKCLDTQTNEEYLCKTTNGSHQKMLSAYFRLTTNDIRSDNDNDQLIRPVKKIIKSANETYLLISPDHFGDLHSYVRERKRIPEVEVRHLFRQICQTVELCHENGIVLRDLKLRRFIFTDRERTKLQCESLEDAVVLDNPDDDTLYEKIGCPTYVAPELLKINSTYAGKAADIWSLGVILYTMLVGRYPFNDQNHSTLFAKISNGSFYLPGWLSSKARCLIRSLLRQRPDERMISSDLLYHPWFKEDEEYDYRKLDEDQSNDDQLVPEYCPKVDSFELT